MTAPGLYRHPPVDPRTGKVSAADDAVLMGRMRHCDVPAPHRKDGCTALMDDHRWIDNDIENGDGTTGVTVCPAAPDHRDHAEQALACGHYTRAIAHALLALVDEFLREDEQ